VQKQQIFQSKQAFSSLPATTKILKNAYQKTHFFPRLMHKEHRSTNYHTFKAVCFRRMSFDLKRTAAIQMVTKNPALIKIIKLQEQTKKTPL
jgi:hypothetical protein